MISKISALFIVLFISGCFGLTRVNTTDSRLFIELQVEALDTCITGHLLFSKESNRMKNTIPGEVACPIYCLLSKLGMVNAAGLNKILVHWIRKFFELEEADSFLFNLSNGPYNKYDDIQKRLNNIFHIIRTTNDRAAEICSSTDAAPRNQLVDEISMMTAFYSHSPENQAIYIPSAENSRYLELAERAVQKCMSNFNVTLPSIIRDIKSKNVTKQNICTVHCMHIELEFMNENGFNQIWSAELRKIYNAAGRLDEYEPLLETGKEVSEILNPYCPSSYNQVPESIKNIWLKFIELEKNIGKIW